MVWKNRKPEPTNVRGICVLCGKNPQKPIANNKFMALCSSCNKRRTPTTLEGMRRNRRDKNKKDRLKTRKSHCERCGFIPEHMCQLDLDHIDGDHFNDDPQNHQTLCANCHRLKTHQNGEWALDLRPR